MTRRASATKAPGSSTQKLNKNLKSDKGEERFPNLSETHTNRMEIHHERVRGALDNMIYPDDVISDYPAPISVSNTWVSASTASLSLNSVENGNGGSNNFQSVLLQNGNPNSPLLGSVADIYEYQADGDGNKGSVLEINIPGDQWGLMYNDRQKLYNMSAYSAVYNRQTWTVVTSAVNSVLTATDTAGNAYDGMFSVTVDGVTTQSAGGNVVYVIPLAGQHLVSINYLDLGDLPRRILKFSVATSAGDSESAPLSQFTLTSYGPSNFGFIKMRSSKYRQNCSQIVITSVQDTLYDGGTILAGQVIASDPPLQPYFSYLYTLKKKREADLKCGCWGPWFPQENEWNFKSSNEEYSQNFCTGDTTFNMYMINYQATNIVGDLNIQVKLDSYVDYVTADTTIPSTPGLVFVDDFLTSISILEACWQFTDNPGHVKMRDILRKTIDYVKSGKPLPTALRAAGAAALKVGVPALMALL